ncbi:MAG TPA: hypothetical protein VE131_03630 [Terriglobales bacterium]|nr:hypothetical protein [Terriglobales bacterium]
MKFFQKLENLFSATAFAEAGEFETARQLVAETAGETEPEAAAPEKAGAEAIPENVKEEGGLRSRRSRRRRSRAA